MNEGCINCGREENYNGADNSAIRYLCSMCTVFGLAKQESALEEFEEVERQLKASKRPRVRISRAKKDKTKKTLSSC